MDYLRTEANGHLAITQPSVRAPTGRTIIVPQHIYVV